MAGDTFDADAGPQRFGTVVVIGGGCYGSYYVRQLRRAAAADAASWRRLIVVDRDPACAVARALRDEGARDVEVVAADWRQFLREHLASAAADPEETRADAIVPSPLMPHLLYDWLLERARARWPERRVESCALARAPDVPWERAAPDGTHYVSFAPWMCPINCIEPRTCPHTRGVRDWSLTRAVPEYAAAERARGESLAGPVIFHCRHRTYGVGMIDTREVLAGDELVRGAATASAATLLVGTVSHCHGALDRLVIGPPVEQIAGSAGADD